MTRECAIVPLTSIPKSLPAITFDVPLNPPKCEYLDADNPPSGPCARRKPNSNRDLSGPAAKRILIAFVAMSEGKLTKFNNVVSNNCVIAKGPSIRSNGCLGNTTYR